jgi:hypothetical protein
MSNTRLQELTSIPLEIVWHENKSTFLSIRKDRGSLSLRLHRLFYDAPSPVLEALIKYALKKDRPSLAVIKQMAHLHFSKHSVEVKPLSPQGKFYHLQEIFDRLLTLLPIKGVQIGWSERKRVGKLRSITFGSFDRHARQIRIHPILDDPQVPLYFLEFIVYHEMLHAVCSTKMSPGGRCSVHTPEFRERERQFPQFKQAMEWEKQCLTFFKKRKPHGRS